MITILTDPVAVPPKSSFPFLTWWNEATRKLGGRSQTRKRYGGHEGVTRSLMEGLTELGMPHRYNPSSVNQIGETVVVLSGVTPLRQAIEWKRTGRIRTLLVGPNLVVRSNEHDSIMVAPEIDVCLVPSNWVRRAYLEDTPSLEGRIKIWAAGVDHRYWDGLRKDSNTQHVLIYKKNGPEELYQTAKAHLKSMGWNPVTLVYGAYDQSQYRDFLRSTVFAVFLSRSESQGLALAEAWAMNVPTFVWDPGELTLHGRWYSEVSSCPYLTNATGVTWKTLEGFREILSYVTRALPTFEPRKWVLSHMTDEFAARNLINIVSEVTSAMPWSSVRQVYFT